MLLQVPYNYLITSPYILFPKDNFDIFMLVKKLDLYDDFKKMDTILTVVKFLRKSLSIDSEEKNSYKMIRKLNLIKTCDLFR